MIFDISVAHFASFAVATGESLLALHATFAAYGQILAVHAQNATLAGTSEAAFKSNLGYSGEQWDASLRMQNLRARAYDPANGRFIGLDPFAGNMQDPQSLHKYAYVHGDPVQGIDPTGMFLGSALISLVSFLGINVSKSNNDIGRGASAGLTTWALWTKRSLDLFFALHVGGAAAATVGFTYQGRLSAKIAAAYTLGVTLGLTGIGQIYTRIFDDGYEFLDDGSMRVASSDARKYWMFERASEEGLLDAARHNWVSVRTTNFENTGKVVNVTTGSSFWINGLHSFEAHGQFQIRIVNETAVSYEVEVKDVAVHWVGNDRADANPSAEKDNALLFAAESYVGHVGDGLLGADFDFQIHDQELSITSKRLVIWKDKIGKSSY